MPQATAGVVQPLITRGDVQRALDAAAKLGWTPKNRAEIEAAALEDSHPLPKLLRASAGAKFLKQAGGERLIYDRLHRIVEEPGGERLVADLLKLPDGARYARDDRVPGVPNLVELLPKNRSGKTRVVKGYDKPTGAIYTADELLIWIRQSSARP